MKLAEVLSLNDKDLNEVIILSKLIPDEVPLLFNCKSFKLLKYKHVLNLKTLVQNNNIGIDLICTLAKYNKSNFKEKDLEKADAKNYFRTLNFIKKEFEELSKMEKSLETPTDVKLIQAGIGKLSQFNELNIIDTLAGGDILKWKKIINLTWLDVFNKLYKNKVEAEIKEALELQRDIEMKAKRKLKW